MKLPHLYIARAARTPETSRKSDEISDFSHMRPSVIRHINSTCAVEHLCTSLYVEKSLSESKGVILAALYNTMGMKKSVYKRTHLNSWYLSVGSPHCQTVKECLNTNKLHFLWMKSSLWCAITGCVLGSSKFEWMFSLSLMRFTSPLGTHGAVNNSFQMLQVRPWQQPADGCEDDRQCLHTQLHPGLVGLILHLFDSQYIEKKSHHLYLRFEMWSIFISSDEHTTQT